MTLHPDNLYPRLLGTGWEQLGGAVQAAHAIGVENHGEFHITRGQHFFSSLLARCAGLPSAASGVKTRLLITTTHGHQRWERHFDGRPFITWQSAGPGGHLLERAGPFEFCFRLRVRGGVLHYDQKGVRLCLGPLRIPFPLAPFVVASEAGDGPYRVRVAVLVRLPLFGHLIAYNGWLATREAAP